MNVAHPDRHLAGSGRTARRPLAALHLPGIPLAGILSLAANLCCLNAALAARLSPHAAWAIAFEIGTLVSFGVHQSITLRGRWPIAATVLAGRLLRFHAGALFAVVLNLFVFSLLVRAGLPLMLDDLAGITAGFTLNTFVGLRFSFAH
jgi:putative flippase GtrA